MTILRLPVFALAPQFFDKRLQNPCVARHFYCPRDTLGVNVIDDSSRHPKRHRGDIVFEFARAILHIGSLTQEQEESHRPDVSLTSNWNHI